MWRKEPTVYKGKLLRLSIYADDNIPSGPDKKEAKMQSDRILSQLAGRAIEPIVSKGGMMWDCLGADLWYSREKKAMKLIEHTCIYCQSDQAL
jgi:hypothetical protein